MRISCIHQGHELYGSDRSFAETVATIRGAFPAAEIDVVLPREGTLVKLLTESASRILIEPVWVLRRRNLLRLAATCLLGLPLATMRAVQRMRRSDLVYINTSVVMDYILAARFFRSRTLLHIHEIPEGMTLSFLRALVCWSGAEIIFNSKATQQAFRLPSRFKTSVVYNGLSGPKEFKPSDYDGQRPLRVLMLGRFNRIKGQEILIQAVALLPAAIRSRLMVRIVGGAYEDKELESAIRTLVIESSLSSVITIEPFTPEPSELYSWADVVAVPSHKPESLGRVAIEAMAFARPTIASAIGGLVEVVEDGKTGWLVPPGNVASLARVLQSLVENPGSWFDFGLNARARYLSHFSERAASEAIGSILKRKLAPSPASFAVSASEPATLDVAQ